MLNRINPATGKIQKLAMLSHGKATSRAPICSGMTKLPKRSGHERNQHEPNHRRPWIE